MFGIRAKLSCDEISEMAGFLKLTSLVSVTSVKSSVSADPPFTDSMLSISRGKLGFVSSQTIRPPEITGGHFSFLNTLVAETPKITSQGRDLWDITNELKVSTQLGAIHLFGY